VLEGFDITMQVVLPVGTMNRGRASKRLISSPSCPARGAADGADHGVEGGLLSVDMFATLQAVNHQQVAVTVATDGTATTKHTYTFEPDNG
jgi:hypothetical protein